MCAAALLTTGACGLSSRAYADAATPLAHHEARIASGAVVLVGTLVLPAGEDLVPGVVVLHGSGPETRTPYLPDARMLASHGYAALVFDKRGTGASTGTLAEASLDDLRADGLAALRWLRAHPRVRPDRTGVLGVSQGGWLAPFMAAQSRDVAFLVQITAAATPLATQEMWRVGNALARSGYSERAMRTAINAYDLLFSTRPLVRRGILPLDDVWFGPLDPWLDPATAWRQVDVPSLVLFAGRDAVVPTYASRIVLGRLLDVPEHARSRLVVFGDAVHALGGPSRNRDPSYVATVVGWLDAVTGDAQQPPSVAPAAGPGPAVGESGSVRTRPRWHASAWLHLPSVLVLTVAYAAMLAASAVPPPGWRTVAGRGLLAAVGTANLALVASVVATVALLLDADAAAHPVPVLLRLTSTAAAWTSSGLAIVTTLAAALRDRTQRARTQRVSLVAVVLGSWAGVILAVYWGLLDGPT